MEVSLQEVHQLESLHNVEKELSKEEQKERFERAKQKLYSKGDDSANEETRPLIAGKNVPNLGFNDG